ncbi:alpha-soluble NSF attachment protein [Trichonephila clavipes]|nr:alpha-soluble NSF attachment protein [Trichonephila clavipes]
MNEEHGQRKGKTLCLLTNRASACNITMVGFKFRHRVRIAGTLNSQRYISEVLEPVGLPYVQRLPATVFQQDNAQRHVARNAQEFFFAHLIQLLPWSACSPDLSPIDNVWFMLVQRLVQDTPPAATPDQLQ